MIQRMSDEDMGQDILDQIIEQNISPQAKTLGISPGEIPRSQLHDAIVEHVLSKGDPNQT